MSTLAEEFDYILPIEEEMVVSIRGKDISFHEIGVDEIALMVNRVPAARQFFLAGADGEFSEDDEKQAEIELIALAVFGIKNANGDKYEASKERFANLTKFERRIIVSKIMSFVMPHAVIQTEAEEAVGNAPKAVKTKTAKAPTRPQMGKAKGR